MKKIHLFFLLKCTVGDLFAFENSKYGLSVSEFRYNTPKTVNQKGDKKIDTLME